jgi:hypothetical protein
LTGVAMEHGPVLDVAAFADDDRADISAGHRGGPEAGASGQLNVADQHGTLCDPGFGMDGWCGPRSAGHGRAANDDLARILGGFEAGHLRVIRSLGAQLWAPPNDGV